MTEERYPDISQVTTKETWEHVYKPDVDTYLLMDVLTQDKEFIEQHHPFTALEIETVGCAKYISVEEAL
jgi:release factor glutamine methyltransferase